VLWPATGAALLVAAWGLVVLARRWNGQDRALPFYGGLTGASGLAAAGSAALLAGPWLTGLQPTRHAYDAIVWLLVIWTVLLVVLGLIMVAYCLFRRWRGRMTARHEIDMGNTVLFWHFVLLTVVVTTLVIAGFPLVA